MNKKIFVLFSLFAILIISSILIGFFNYFNIIKINKDLTKSLDEINSKLSYNSEQNFSSDDDNIENDDIENENDNYNYYENNKDFGLNQDDLFDSFLEERDRMFDEKNEMFDDFFQNLDNSRSFGMNINPKGSNNMSFSNTYIRNGEVFKYSIKINDDKLYGSLTTKNEDELTRYYELLNKLDLNITKESNKIEFDGNSKYMDEVLKIFGKNFDFEIESKDKNNLNPREF
ncbi:hypothetical protein [Candidatus Vampirococcus lugosii]|uniref:Uncharacterized protein n=1 Tax=Candidatus Vampirococcus lugosii TaxID=2789015 RepID=A0ABS5QM21_9BACT|nr:hypothetical protein [Candidatus Vampirococcus lugosii]MBS8122247.1 hypothetical protein [Candidatus Vampirococcus lugosii]MBS8122251.1 hypothetical protein [Candidatus Vampirococcus lugosii]